MKKIILPLLLWRAAVRRGGAAAGNAVQDQYRTVRTARLEAEVTSHTDTDSRTFTLLCSYDAAGDAVTTVTQPHELAGLTAVASGEDLTLACEGLQLPVGRVLGHLPRQLPALPAAGVGERLRAGAGRRDAGGCPPGLRLTLDTTGASGGKVLCAVWLDESGLFPRYAEFSQDGQTVLTVRLLSFECTTAPPDTAEGGGA